MKRLLSWEYKFMADVISCKVPELLSFFLQIGYRNFELNFAPYFGVILFQFALCPARSPRLLLPF